MFDQATVGYLSGTRSSVYEPAARCVVTRRSTHASREQLPLPGPTEAHPRVCGELTRRPAALKV